MDRAHKKFVLILCGIVILRAILTVVLWNHTGGFFWLTADDASRTQLASLWSQAPFFNLPGNVWPPLGIWLHGAVLKFYDDPLVTSSAVNSIFSIASIIVIYRLTGVLFPDQPSAPVLAAVTAGFCPLVVWLGLSGLSEAIFHFFMLLGVYFLVLAHRDHRPGLYFGAAAGLLAASMIRFEAWIFVGLFGAYCLVASRRNEHRFQILASAALAWVFVAAWLGWHWRVFGNPFFFLQYYQAHNGEAGFGQFVTLLWDNSPIALILALVGVAISLGSRSPGAIGNRHFYLLLVSAFYVCFVFLSRGRIAANLPVRNLTSVFWLLVPFAASATAFVMTRLPFSRSFIYLVVSAWIVGGSIQSFGYHFQARDEVVKIATWSRNAIRAGSARDGSNRILIEMRHGGPDERDVVWDSLVLHAVNPRYTLYDRQPALALKDGDWVLNEQDNSSLLLGPAGGVAEMLRSQHVRFVIGYSTAARGVLDSIMKPISRPNLAEPVSRSTVAGARIAATPNPVPSGPGLGSTTVSWTTGNQSAGKVYFSFDGGPLKFWGTGASGSQEAPWILARGVYEFRLYSDNGTLIASVAVERQQQEYRVYGWPADEQNAAGLGLD